MKGFAMLKIGEVSWIARNCFTYARTTQFLPEAFAR